MAEGARVDASVADGTAGTRDEKLSGRPRDLSPGQRVETVSGGDRWMQAEAFVYEHYRAIGYCDESPRNRVEEMARWADDSRFHVVIDADDEIVGSIRTMFGAYADLPVGTFERTDRSHEDPVCEFGSLVVRPGSRSTGVIEHLYRNAWLDAIRSASTSVVALIDPWLLRVFLDAYAMPFQVIGESQPYMGSDPVPVGMSLDGTTYDELARRNPHFWTWILEKASTEEIVGRGLPIILPGSEVIDEERTAEVRRSGTTRSLR